MKYLLIITAFLFTSCLNDKPEWIGNEKPECWSCTHHTPSEVYTDDVCDYTTSEIKAYERHNSPKGTSVRCVMK